MKKKSGIKTKLRMKRKTSLLFIVFSIVLLALAGRIIYISQINGDSYQRRVLAQQGYSSKTIPYKRGDITDRNGIKLATSTKVYNLILDPKIILSSERYPAVTIKAVSELFDYDPIELETLIRSRATSSYMPLKKELTYDDVLRFDAYVQRFEEEKKEKRKELKEIKDEDVKKDPQLTGSIQGVWFEEEYIRMYPQNMLAADVIGFTAKGNVGTWGLEGVYNDILNGENGREYGILGEESMVDRTIKPAKTGYSVVSTIDYNMQAVAEDELKKWNEEFGSLNSAVLIMDPNTGEILTMASYPFFDPNNPMDLSDYFSEEELEEMDMDQKLTILNGIWRNFNINDTYEPGSTAKPITIAAALEEGVILPTDTFFCDGYEIVNGRRINCSNEKGHGEITLAQSLAFSCNDALMQIADKLNKKEFLKYQSVFGLGQKTNIDLPGEESAQHLVFTEERMGPIELATNSFGQSFNVTPVQLITAFSSIVNGGYLYEPHMVKKIVDQNGTVIKNIEKKVVKRTVSQETSKLISQYLVDTVFEGTGKRAQIEGFTIGGKTGTAEKLPREDKKRIVSFIGMVPAENPQLAMLVIIDEPENVEPSSALATSMFNRIFQRILPYANIYANNE